MGKHNKKFIKIEKTEATEVKEETLPEVVVSKEETVVKVKGYADVEFNTTLNIRKSPVVRPNNQVAIIGKDVELTVVDPDNPIDSEGELWYKVEVDDQPGYAMKKFVKVIVEEA